MHQIIVEASKTVAPRAKRPSSTLLRWASRQDADQFVLRAVERLAGATFRSDGAARKTTKCDIEKLTPKAATIETNFATNTLAILRKDNKGGGPKYYPKRRRSGEADVLLPTERATAFQAEVIFVFIA